MPKYDRFLLVVMADEHAGSKLGLCNPEVVLTRTRTIEKDGDLVFEDYEYRPHIEPLQEKIWERYLQARDEYIELAGKDPIYLIKLGEVCEGTYYKNSSMHLKKHNQVEMAVANMEPWRGVKNLKMVRITIGDRPHEFDEGAAGHLVASMLKQDFLDTRATAHGVLDFRTGDKPFKVDYAHRGPYPGSRKWLEGNVARYYLTDYMMREKIEFDRKPVDLLLRAHYHEPVHEMRFLRHKNGFFRSALMIAPCMKWADAHGRQATQNRFSGCVGMDAVEVVNGNIVDFHESFTMADIRSWEVVDG